MSYDMSYANVIFAWACRPDGGLLVKSAVCDFYVVGDAVN